VLLEITTTGKTVLLVVAALFIAWALVTAVIVPRRNPDFPLSVGAFIAVSAVFFIAQMGAVYWVTSYQEVESETAGEVAGGGETTPAETTPAETTTTETTPAETTTTETTPAETTTTETTPAETTTTETTPAETTTTETTPAETTTTETTPAETTTTETTPTETTPTETTPTETTPTETTPTETTPAGGAEGDATAGKEVFATAGCGSCHTLADAGATATVGPNLDEAKPSADRVVERVTNGQGVMPPFKDQLDEQQIKDVAAYVSSVAGSSP